MIRQEFKAASELEVMTAALVAIGLAFNRIGLEAGPLLQWLHAGHVSGNLEIACHDEVHADQDGSE